MSVPGCFDGQGNPLPPTVGCNEGVAAWTAIPLQGAEPGSEEAAIVRASEVTQAEKMFSPGGMDDLGKAAFDAKRMLDAAGIESSGKTGGGLWLKVANNKKQMLVETDTVMEAENFGVISNKFVSGKLVFESNKSVALSNYFFDPTFFKQMLESMMDGVETECALSDSGLLAEGLNQTAITDFRAFCAQEDYWRIRELLNKFVIPEFVANRTCVMVSENEYMPIGVIPAQRFPTYEALGLSYETCNWPSGPMIQCKQECGDAYLMWGCYNLDPELELSEL